ncbi:MAG: archaetidylserine decarboxylase [Halorhodospira sp.]
MSHRNPPEPPRAEPGPSPADRLRGIGHRLLPTRLLSQLTRNLARCRWPWLKDRINRFFAERYRLELSEAEHPVPEAYPTFHALFTRALRPDARPLPADPGAVASPCDGTVSAVGCLRHGQLLQAKGIDYSAAALLDGAADPEAFRDGAFLTLYLSPSDYHRFHAPLDARLVAERHVPGRLLTVAPAAVRSIPGLFLRNERLVTSWESAAGPMAYIPVGALNVGSIETVWGGEAGDPPGHQRSYPGDQAPHLRRGDELGRFNLGSTIILLFGPGTVWWRPDLAPGQRVQMGEPLGTIATCPDQPASASSACTSERGAPETPLR